MAKPKKIYDPYASLIAEFNRTDVRYLVVGMSGINYYATDAREVISTLDFDVFLKPTMTNVRQAIRILHKRDYSIMINGEDHATVMLVDVVRSRSTIVASNPYGILIELILAVSGFTFGQMGKNSKCFMVNRVPVRVAGLKELIASKKIANRNKDRLFLKRYEMLLRDRYKKNKR